MSKYKLKVNIHFDFMQYILTEMQNKETSLQKSFYT